MSTTRLHGCTARGICFGHTDEANPNGSLNSTVELGHCQSLLTSECLFCKQGLLSRKKEEGGLRRDRRKESMERRGGEGVGKEGQNQRASGRKHSWTRPALSCAWYVTGRSVFPAPVMGGCGRVWSRDESQETTAGRHVGEVTGYTTGLWEDWDCANCIDRFDALVGTAGCCDGREQAIPCACGPSPETPPATRPLRTCRWRAIAKRFLRSCCLRRRIPGACICTITPLHKSFQIARGSSVIHTGVHRPCFK